MVNANLMYSEVSSSESPPSMYPKTGLLRAVFNCKITKNLITLAFFPLIFYFFPSTNV